MDEYGIHNLNKQATRKQFQNLAELPDQDMDLVEGALLIAAEDDPKIQVQDHIGRIEELASLVRPRIQSLKNNSHCVIVLNQFLYHEQGFRGNYQDYYDPKNTYLNHVLDRKMRIPISLITIYIGIAKCLGIKIEGVNFPGHFLAKFTGEREMILDPFHGVVLSLEECQTYLMSLVSQKDTFTTRGKSSKSCLLI